MKKGSVKYPKTEVKKSKAGKGIFATEEIKRGTKILQYIGLKVSTDHANENPNRYIFEIDENWSLDGSPMWNTARYFNHSCIPNAESIMEGDDRIFIAAKKKILPGDEITFDYGEEYINDYIKKGGCKCAKCSLVF